MPLSITMKHLILGFKLACAALAAFTACTTTRESTEIKRDSPTFQLRLVQDARSRDSSEMTIVPPRGSLAPTEVLHVQNAVLLDETAVKSAKVQTNSSGHPEIEITFTETGRKRFADVTRESIGKRLAIVINGQLYSAPKIMSEIPGGKATISGDFSKQEAEALVEHINASLTR